MFQTIDAVEEATYLLLGATIIDAALIGEDLRSEQRTNKEGGHQQGLQRALGLDEVEIGSLHGLISLLMD